MAFSFFRGKNDREPGKEKPAPSAPAGDAQPAPVTFLPTLAHDAIQVDEAIGLDDEILEAVTLYASNQLAATEASLKRALDHAGKPEVWHMLFDLYRAMGDESGFEQLALAYATRFETSPPMWVDRGASAEADKAALANFAFSGNTETLAAECEALLTASIEHPQGVRVSLAKLADLDLADCSNLRRCLEILRHRAALISLVSAQALMATLRAGLDQADEARWLLLLELHQLGGDMEAFEDLAVDYAVRFELSPPSWQPGACGIQDSPAKFAEPDALCEAFALQGVIGAREQAQLDALARYGQGRAEVVLDFSAVPRVDYDAVGNLLHTLMALVGGGSRVVIREANSLVAALLRSMGVDQLAEIHTAKLV
jgi:anti-anti-sigma regulatory factor